MTKNITLESIIKQVTAKAYENATQWMSTDSKTGCQLRDGLRTFLSACDKINTDSDDPHELLDLVQREVDSTLAYYGRLPGDDGTWECSALRIVKGEIESLRQAR